MKSLFVSLLSLLLLTSAPACDLCGCYLAPQEVVPRHGSGFYAGVSEQFTHFGTLQFNDREVGNPSGQYLDSSITQLVLGAAFLEHRLALQINVPVIYRSFQRPEGFATDRGHESGLGDISLLANMVVYRRPAVREGDFSTTLNLIGGLKLPTWRQPPHSRGV